MKDYLIVATLLISLFGSIVVCLLSTQLVFAAGVKECSALAISQVAMRKLNKRSNRR